MKYLSLVVLSTLACGLGACSQPHHYVRSVEEFMQEPALLHGVVLQCNARVEHAKHERECINAWAAVERLGAADDAQKAPKLEQQFERNREKARIALEQRDAATREKPFDPYRAPVATDAPPPATPVGNP